MGYQYSIVLGSDTYYPKTGYIQTEKFGVEVPQNISVNNFMAIVLQEKAKEINGTITYAKEFGM